jgi:hypothetical protein
MNPFINDCWYKYWWVSFTDGSRVAGQENVRHCIQSITTSIVVRVLLGDEAAAGCSAAYCLVHC